MADPVRGVNAACNAVLQATRAELVAKFGQAAAGEHSTRPQQPDLGAGNTWRKSLFFTFMCLISQHYVYEYNNDGDCTGTRETLYLCPPVPSRHPVIDRRTRWCGCGGDWRLATHVGLPRQ